MGRIALAYQLESVEVIVLPTALFINASEVNTVIRRIRHRSVNLAVVRAINQMSRDVSQHPIPVDELEENLRRASATARYRPEANLFFAGVGAGALNPLMGGHPIDILPAMIGGSLTQLVRQWFRAIGLANGVSDMVAAAVAVVPALAAANVGIPHAGSILVASIMVLTPGLLMTTAVRDGIQGDLLSAAARILEALISAGAIAAGASLPLYIYLALGGRWA